MWHWTQVQLLRQLEWDTYQVSSTPKKPWNAEAPWGWTIEGTRRVCDEKSWEHARRPGWRLVETTWWRNLVANPPDCNRRHKVPTDRPIGHFTGHWGYRHRFVTLSQMVFSLSTFCHLWPLNPQTSPLHSSQPNIFCLLSVCNLFYPDNTWELYNSG